MPFSGFVVNRVHAQAPPAPEPGALADALGRRAELHGFAPYELMRAAEAIRQGHDEIGTLADADRREVVRLGQVLQRGQTLVEVPFLERDVHDVEGLAVLGRHIFARSG
jgi:hypothetical protein